MRPKHKVFVSIPENIYRQPFYFSYGYKWEDETIQTFLKNTLGLTEQQIKWNWPGKGVGARWTHSDDKSISMIWISPGCHSLLTAIPHEAIHLAMDVLTRRGVPISEENSEALTYLVEYYINEMFYLAGFGELTHHKAKYKP